MTESADPSPARKDVFATTHWTRVLAARGTTTEARAALSVLCEAYYEPVVAFLRAQTRHDDQARDLAHAFFQYLLGRDGLEGVDPERGRFRSYLLGAVKHYVAGLRERERAAKRGHGIEHVPLSQLGEEEAIPDAVAQSEHAFDQQWAFTILGRALDALKEEERSQDRLEQFEALKPWLSMSAEKVPQAEVAARLGWNEGAMKVRIHRLRRRFREGVRAQILDTVRDRGDVDGELAYLIEVVSATGPDQRDQDDRL